MRKHHPNYGLTGFVTTCVEDGEDWPCRSARAANEARRRRAAANGTELPTSTDEPTALQISQMSRSEYLAFCARHLANARQRARP